MSLAAIASGRRIPGVLGVVAIAAVVLLAVALLPGVPEPQRFQSLADNRRIFGIANFLNVVSNVPFLIVGVWGLWFVARHATNQRLFADPRERWPYLVCFLAVALTLSATGTFLATLGSPWFGLAAITLAAVGGKCAATLFWPMAQSGLDLKIAAPGLAVVNSIGNLGGFVSPTLFGYLKDTTGTTNGGLYTLSAASLLAVLGVALIRRNGGSAGSGSGSDAGEPALAKGQLATGQAR